MKRRHSSRWETRAVVALLAAFVATGAALSVPRGVAADDSFGASDSRVRDAMTAWGVPGLAYGLVRDGEIVHLGAFGTADPAGRALTPQTPIVIGSVGKSITALAIRQLVEAGRIDLDAPVTRYLPWFAIAGPVGAAERITVRSLVEHTSGLSTAVGQDPRWYAPDLTPVDVVRGLASEVATGTPGQYAYSNVNYVVLGVVVEAVSGTSYGDYLQAHVFGPLDMTHSFTSLEAAREARPAQGHRYLFGVPVPFDEPYPSAMVAAGYQVSTAEDMARYAAALANGGILDGIDIVSPTSGGGGAAGRSFGTDWLPLDPRQADAIISQSGSTLNSNADLLIVPARRLGVVVLLNANPTELFGAPAGAADVAMDVLSLSFGVGRTTSAPSVRTVYLVVDAILLLALVAFLAHLVRARTWRGRLAASTHRRSFVARAIVADGVLPACVLVGVPLWIGSTGSTRAGDVLGGWRFAAWTMPDIALPLIVFGVGAVAIGVAKLVGSQRAAGVPAVPRR